MQMYAVFGDDLGKEKKIKQHLHRKQKKNKKLCAKAIIFRVVNFWRKIYARRSLCMVICALQASVFAPFSPISTICGL